MLWISLFCASAAVPVYVLLIYPALLGVLSRWRGRPFRAAPRTARVSIVIAVANGEGFIAGKLRSVLDLDYPKEMLEVLVISDGSTDRTDSIVEGFAADGVELLRIPKSGKPAALNAGIARARGEILLLTDVRQTLARGSLQLLVNCFADPSVGAASGKLLIRKAATQEEEAIGLYWRYETWIRSKLSLLDSTFGAVGPFYALRRELAVHIPEDILLDDVYLPLAAYLAGYRLVVENRAVAWDHPMPLRAEFRRKVRTIAGNYQILTACPALLGPRNRMWFHFMSYKFGRLILPQCLAAAAVSSVLLPAPWGWIAMEIQAGFYGLAAIDPLIPERAAVKRISSTARAFTTFILAAVCAMQVFFVPPRSLWKATETNPRPVREGM